MPEYPKREPFHAHKLTRLLFKSCAIQDIGNNAALLIVHIAHTEDAARYQYPVRFWNGQLMHVMGWHSPKQLTEARRKAVEAGWLHYERDQNRKVGKYWTMIPPTVTAFNDEPIEPCFVSVSGMNNHSENGTDNLSATGNISEIGTSCGTNSGMNHGTNSGKPSIPVPVPDPPPPQQKKVAGVAELVIALRQEPYGLRYASRAIKAASRSGVTLDEIRTIADFWEQAGKNGNGKPAPWDRCDLYERIANAMPGEQPDKHWPPPHSWQKRNGGKA